MNKQLFYYIYFVLVLHIFAILQIIEAVRFDSRFGNVEILQGNEMISEGLTSWRGLSLIRFQAFDGLQGDKVRPTSFL